MVARAWLLQGLKDGDVVHSCYAHGMVNAGHFVREAALHYTRALLLSAGAGNETPSVSQGGEHGRGSAPACWWASPTTFASWRTLRAAGGLSRDATSACE